MGLSYKTGDEIHGFRLTKRLGRGGFGEVWRGTGPGGTEAALKIIPLSQRQGYKEYRAIHLVKQIRHPNLVPIMMFWLRDEDGNFISDTVGMNTMARKSQNWDLIIAMGLGEKNLYDRLQECLSRGQQGIPLEELLGYMEDSAKAIDFLNLSHHDLGEGPIAIQHCDIKPQNILIVGGAAQICDMGVARVLDDSKNVSIAGTSAYMAPEMIATNQPSKATDQYCLAISYVELRTGSLPLDVASPAGAIWAHMQGNLDLSKLPAGERAVIKKATSVDPEKRYPTTVEMVRALRRACEPEEEEPAEEPEKPKLIERIVAGGEIVPGYKLVRLLGKGGYGQVWEAAAPGGKRVALKIIQNLEAARGRQEFRALEVIKGLDHNHLMELHAYWLLDAHGTVIHDDHRDDSNALPPSVLVIASKLAGKNLQQRLEECQKAGLPAIPEYELLPYIRQTAEAIDYLNHPSLESHDRRDAVQHRDIKPENILLAANTVKLGDFGLAKVLEGTSAAVHSDSAGLTIHYAAPELFAGTVTCWTDQYSLAISYFKLRTGHLPFPKGMSTHDIILGHVTGKLDLSALPESERAVVARATDIKPESRYPTCMAFVEALERAIRPRSREMIPTQEVCITPPPSTSPPGSQPAWSAGTTENKPPSHPVLGAATMEEKPPAPRLPQSHVDTARPCFETVVPDSPILVPPTPSSHGKDTHHDFRASKETNVDLHPPTHASPSNWEVEAHRPQATWRDTPAASVPELMPTRLGDQIAESTSGPPPEVRQPASSWRTEAPPRARSKRGLIIAGFVLLGALAAGGYFAREPLVDWWQAHRVEPTQPVKPTEPVKPVDPEEALKVLIGGGQFADAMTALEKVPAADQEKWKERIRSAWVEGIRKKVGDPKEAGKSLDEFLRRFPTDAELPGLQLAVAESFARQKRFREAWEVARNLKESAPERSALRDRLAREWLDLLSEKTRDAQQLEAAADELKAIDDLRADLSIPYRALERSLDLRIRLRKAEPEKIAKDLAWFRRAGWRVENIAEKRLLDDFAEATVKKLDAGLTDDKSPAEKAKLLFAKGQVCYAMNRLNEADSALEKAAEWAGPADRAAFAAASAQMAIELAESHVKDPDKYQQDLKIAESRASNILKEDKTNPEGSRVLGQAYELGGSPAKALLEYRRVLRNPDSASRSQFALLLAYLNCVLAEKWADSEGALTVYLPQNMEANGRAAINLAKDDDVEPALKAQAYGLAGLIPYRYVILAEEGVWTDPRTLEKYFYTAKELPARKRESIALLGDAIRLGPQLLHANMWRETQARQIIDLLPTATGDERERWLPEAKRNLAIVREACTTKEAQKHIDEMLEKLK